MNCRKICYEANFQSQMSISQKHCKMNNVLFKIGDCIIECQPSARLLIETSRGTGSYSLHRGYSASEWQKAAETYAKLPSGDGDKKRVTLTGDGKPRVVARDG